MGCRFCQVGYLMWFATVFGPTTDRHNGIFYYLCSKCHKIQKINTPQPEAA